MIGKKIAVPPADSHRVLWPAFAKVNKLDESKVTMVNVKPEGKQAIVAAGEVDASFDLYTSYAIWEKVLGKGQVGNLLWADYGLPIYGHTYFVNTEMIAKNPKLIERFLRATHKGWRDAHADPGGGHGRHDCRCTGAGPRGAARHHAADHGPVHHRALEEERHRLDRARDHAAKTIDITYAGGKMDRVVKLDEVFTNTYSSKIADPVKAVRRG